MICVGRFSHLNSANATFIKSSMRCYYYVVCLFVDALVCVNLTGVLTLLSFKFILLSRQKKYFNF